MQTQTDIQSFDDVIEAFGGPAKFAKAIGIKPFHGQTMKTRGSIPPSYWSDTVAAAELQAIEGVTLERLAEIAKLKASA